MTVREREVLNEHRKSWINPQGPGADHDESAKAERLLSAGPGGRRHKPALASGILEHRPKSAPSPWANHNKLQKGKSTGVLRNAPSHGRLHE